VNSRSAKTKVLVKNGQTAVIGGIYQSDQSLSEAKVPWVGDIPILGWLFKNHSQDNQKNELLIFLTPRILGQADSQAIPSADGTGGEL
jgi:type IV pilus assembly protein PilQ